MKEPLDIELTREIVRQVIPFMSKKRIPMTPDNYHLWFEYFRGQDSELKEHLDSLLAGGTIFTPELNDELFKRFFVRDLQEESTEKVQRELELAEEIGEKVSRLLSETINEILASVENSSEYGDKLKDYGSRMKKASRLEDVQTLLASLLRDTQEAELRSGRAQKKIEKSSHELEKMNRELAEAKKEARTDNLTGIYNRRFFDEALKKAMQRAKKDKSDLSLLMLDIDHFKSFNDRFGHIVGDNCLVKVAKEINVSIPKTCLACRFGGEEFAVICPGMALDRATRLAEGVIRLIRDIEFTVRGKSADVTISAGSAEFCEGDSVESFMSRADRALYFAKNSGRNNVKSEKEVSDGAEIPED